MDGNRIDDRTGEPRGKPNEADAQAIAALVEARRREEARPATDVEPPPVDGNEDVDRQGDGRVARGLRMLGRTIATCVIFAVAVLAAVLVWSYYVNSPWTRNGRVRVQVASIAPQVSGQIVEVRVSDNQYVHKGDVLYVIDPFNYQSALDSAHTQLRIAAADLEVKKVQAQRRQALSDLSATVEDKQVYAGNASSAQASFDAAQVQVSQADINLQRTQVRSPVNGYVTNLLMRVGDYAAAGTRNISVIDADSYWIDGYFEETKMAHVCIGDRAEAQLMGYADPIIGRVDTVTRGISEANAAPSTQGLPSVDPVYTWVRLAQRVPVRIAITSKPPEVPLVAGMTATVTIRPPASAAAKRSDASMLTQLLHDAVYGPTPRPGCITALSAPEKPVETIPTPTPPKEMTPGQIAPGLTPGMAVPPKQ